MLSADAKCARGCLLQWMPSELTKRKRLLFVDDDANFLSIIQKLFSQMAKASWEITAAQNHAQALEILRQGQVDLVVLDFKMPVMDGVQFLKLLARTHPGQQAAILTAVADESTRRACEQSGAALCLQKPVGTAGFASVFSALDALAGAATQEGFRGVMRRMGIQDVLQMECLGLKSSVLEIFTGRVRGRIFICEGVIVHAESGAIQGETALYGLLGLRGGEFNFSEYSEPPRRTIAGHWEHLLMEAARLSDEGQTFLNTETIEAVPDIVPEPTSEVGPASEPALYSTLKPQAQDTTPSAEAAATPPPHTSIDVQIEEILLCSGAGNILYEYGCKKVEGRQKLLEQVEHQARQLSETVKIGVFDRLEIVTVRGRIVCQVQPQRRIFVRSTRGKVQPV